MKKILLATIMTVLLLGAACKKVTNVYPNVGTEKDVQVQPGESTSVTAEEIIASEWTINAFAFDNGNTHQWKLKSNKNKIIIFNPAPHDLFWAKGYEDGSKIDSYKVLALWQSRK